MSPSKTVEANGRRVRRALVACDFCRRRKMKCGNETPKCKNCEASNKDCIYFEISKKPRPSNARIDHLEQENRRLQDALRLSLERDTESKSQEEYVTETTPPNTVGKSQAGGLASPRSQFRDSRTQTHPRYRSDTATELLRSAPFLPTTSATDREPRYHGPTSALFDEKPSDRGISRRDTDTVASEGLAKSRLMAEAARQRQLEAIHLATNKLDFDGVDPSLGMHLLSIYFIRQHDYGMAVYRPVFMRDMACGGPYFSKLLLNAIYFAASTYSRRAEIRHEPEDIRTAGLPYRQRFMELLIAAFDTSEITTIQALIIIANPLFTRCDERSISWLYAGIAFNMIIDLGIHIDISAPTTRTRSEEDLEVRRRVFWAAYVKDKVLSLYQGRPARLREFDTNVTLTFLDEYEELEQFNSLNHTDGEDQPGFPMYSVSTFKAECKLSILMDRIISCLYSEKSPKRNPDDLLRDALALHDDLKAWRVALPTLLDFTSPGSHTSTLLPHMFSLLAMFNVLVILLHRPFVSDGHLQCTSSSAAFDSFVTCATAATEIDHILHAYGRAFQIEYSPYIMAYATYVSATIHVRMAAQRHPGSEAHKSLRTCLHVLSKLQQVYLAPRSAIRIIHSLMKRMGVVIDDHESVRLGHESSGLPDVATWVRSQNGQEFSRGISSSNTDNIENTSRIPPAEIQPDVDLALQDLDMDAIIQSFYLDQQIAQQSLQYSQFQSTVDLSSSDLSPNTRTVRVSASHPVGVMVPSSPASCNVLQDSVAPTLYDPIFGIDTPALLEDDSRLRSGP